MRQPCQGGNTALHNANSRKTYNSVMNVLISFGASLSIPNDQGQSSLAAILKKNYDPNSLLKNIQQYIDKGDNSEEKKARATKKVEELCLGRQTLTVEQQQEIILIEDILRTRYQISSEVEINTSRKRPNTLNIVDDTSAGPSKKSQKTIRDNALEIGTSITSYLNTNVPSTSNLPINTKQHKDIGGVLENKR